MAVDLRCPNCEDNLGKDVENDLVAWCGTCGTRFYNERGDKENLSKSDKQWLKDNKPRPSKRINLINTIRGY